MDKVNKFNYHLKTMGVFTAIGTQINKSKVVNKGAGFQGDLVKLKELTAQRLKVPIHQLCSSFISCYSVYYVLGDELLIRVSDHGSRFKGVHKQPQESVGFIRSCWWEIAKAHRVTKSKGQAFFVGVIPFKKLKEVTYDFKGQHLCLKNSL